MRQNDSTLADVVTSTLALGSDSLYIGVDVGKARHVAGFVSTTLLARCQRFEHCPALTFDNSRLGFRQLVERIETFVPLPQAAVALEATGHYHHTLVQYLQELDLPVFVLHPQTRRAGLLKTDKRDALGLANLLYAQVERGVQLGDPFQAVRRLLPPTPAAERLRGLVRHRYELAHEATQRRNQLTAIADELFPEFTQVCADPNLPSALALRARFPTPARLAAASPQELQATRVGHLPSNAKLDHLRRLAAESIGVRSAARVQGLVFEQGQLIEELQVITHHLDAVEAELVAVVANCREGRILTSIPGVGAGAAAAILASVGNIANFSRATQLKAYCGWAPTLAQSGSSLDRARLSPRGSRLLKRTLYLVAWHAIQVEGSEFRQLYERLLPRQCRYDERLGRYVGRGRPLGRVAGQLINVIYALLKRDEVAQGAAARGQLLAEPDLYDAARHHHHRSGAYPGTTSQPVEVFVTLPAVH